MRTLIVVLAGFLLVLGAAACSDEERGSVDAAPPGMAALEIEEIQLGSDIGPDKRVLEPKDRFAPGDTVYVSIETRGTAVQPADLLVTWHFEDGQVIEQSSKRISPKGQAVTEFHISKPDAWPQGDYEVVVALNGREVGKKEFEVQ